MTEIVLKLLQGGYDYSVPSEYDKRDDTVLQYVLARKQKLRSDSRAAIISILHENDSIKALTKIMNPSPTFIGALYVYNELKSIVQESQTSNDTKIF